MAGGNGTIFAHEKNKNKVMVGIMFPNMSYTFRNNPKDTLNYPCLLQGQLTLTLELQVHV